MQHGLCKIEETYQPFCIVLQICIDLQQSPEVINAAHQFLGQGNLYVSLAQVALVFAQNMLYLYGQPQQHIRLSCQSTTSSDQYDVQRLCSLHLQAKIVVLPYGVYCVCICVAVVQLSMMSRACDLGMQ